MKKLIVLIFLLSCFSASILMAAWEIDINVITTIHKDRSPHALKDSIQTTAENALNNVKINFDTNMIADSFKVSIRISGIKKTVTDLDDFGTTIYNYFNGKFKNGSIAIKYNNTIEW